LLARREIDPLRLERAAKLDQHPVNRHARRPRRIVERVRQSRPPHSLQKRAYYMRARHIAPTHLWQVVELSVLQLTSSLPDDRSAKLDRQGASPGSAARMPNNSTQKERRSWISSTSSGMRVSSSPSSVRRWTAKIRPQLDEVMKEFIGRSPLVFVST